MKGNQALKSVVIKTLICGLSSSCGKEAVISKRLIWDKTRQFGNYKDVYEAIKIDIVFLDNKNYSLMSVVPTLYFKDENITSDRRKNLMLEYLDKNTILNMMRLSLFGNKFFLMGISVHLIIH